MTAPLLGFLGLRGYGSIFMIQIKNYKKIGEKNEVRQDGCSDFLIQIQFFSKNFGKKVKSDKS